MNILFFSLGKYKTINQPGIYTDLLREFANHGHNVFVLSSIEGRDHEKEEIIHEKNCLIIRIPTGDIQKTNIVKKGINTILISNRYISAIKNNLPDTTVDLALYATPPVTFANVVEFLKQRDNAYSYLLLKDIFPQNALDLGMMSRTGVKGLLYKYFRKKEKKLYYLSDRIGCMSKANVEYVIKHNPEIELDTVEICPNSIEIRDQSIDAHNRYNIRKQYGIPLNKTVFIYGGNLGKPQGILFVIDCLKECANFHNSYFLIVGNGTYFDLLEDYITTSEQENVKLMNRLPREDYDKMVGACDVGLIFLDHRFTIPNFPSRLLSYMQAKIPVLAATDVNTDIRAVIKEGNFGWWCESSDVHSFSSLVNNVDNFDIKLMGENGFSYLQKHYDVKNAYGTIINAMGDNK